MLTKNKIDEFELLRAISNGDEKAFEILYICYYKKFHNFLLKTTRQQEDKANDILQESFLRVWLNRDKLLEIENFEAWIYKVVSNEALTLIRKELHLKTKSNRLKLATSSENHIIFDPKPIEFNEIKSIVKKAISKLPPQRQNIYILSREEGLNSKEISIKLNISINTVYNTLTSALKTIREELNSEGYGLYLTTLLILKVF